jgi:hypothetical protein
MPAYSSSMEGVPELSIYTAFKQLKGYSVAQQNQVFGKREDINVFSGPPQNVLYYLGFEQDEKTSAAIVDSFIKPLSDNLFIISGTIGKRTFEISMYIPGGLDAASS